MVVAHLFNHPVVSALLLSLAFLGLVAEVRSAGFGRAGVAGLLALALFFLSHLAEGSSPWSVPWSLLGVVGGLAVLRPALRDPARRWSARVGVGLVAAAAYGAMVPDSAGVLHYARAGVVLAAAGLLVTLVGSLLWMQLPATLRSPGGAGVFFHTARGTAPDEGGGPSRALVGRRGLVVTPLRPEGTVLVEGDRLEVTTDGEWVETGQEVVVTGVGGTRARVRPVTESPA